MAKFLSILFIIIFVIPFLLRSVLRFLFGNPSRQRGPSQYNRSSQQKGNASPSSHTKQSSSKKKVISKNEGEYVDYVEIKD
ncbi:MAG: DUF4834 family protein [Tannerella sp.]|nr:DUF4834 family protein [Tannerella sp.]